MTDNIAAMETALRVLAAITERMKPAPTDVEELHRLAPERPDVALDELACEVVQRARRQMNEVGLFVRNGPTRRHYRMQPGELFTQIALRTCFFVRL